MDAARSPGESSPQVLHLESGPWLYLLTSKHDAVSAERLQER